MNNKDPRARVGLSSEQLLLGLFGKPGSQILPKIVFLGGLIASWNPFGPFGTFFLLLSQFRVFWY